MRLRANLAADAALVLVTLVWGSTFVFGKDVLDRWPPISYMAVRLALATLVLTALFWKRLRAASREAWRAGALLGLLMGAGLVGQATGLAYTTPAKSAFVTGLTTPLVPFVALLMLGARPSFENLVGVTLASVGGFLILAPSGDVGRAEFGDLVTLASTLVFAVHVTLMSLYAARHDARLLTAVQIGVAAALLVFLWLGIRLAVGLVGAQALPPDLARNAEPLAWEAQTVWQLAYLVVVATVAVFLVWTWGQARMSATHAAIIFSLEPVFATLLAIWWRGAHEWPGPRVGFGASFVLAGILVSELRLVRARRGAGTREGDAATEEDED
ncbi:MAG TPA: DMT family transporter, partial [Pyrinomonadaceae bacterium]|nr:DMT family transporter [Pyrinomonadaceae bacterium]